MVCCLQIAASHLKGRLSPGTLGGNVQGNLFSSSTHGDKGENRFDRGVGFATLLSDVPLAILCFKWIPLFQLFVESQQMILLGGPMRQPLELGSDALSELPHVILGDPVRP